MFFLKTQSSFHQFDKNIIRQYPVGHDSSLSGHLLPELDVAFAAVFGCFIIDIIHINMYNYCNVTVNLNGSRIMGNNGITVKDVASACNLSVSTVNYILNGDTTYKFKEATKKKVLDAASRLGYKKNVIASGFRLNNNKIVFGIVSYVCRQSDLRLLIAVKQALYKRGYKFAVQFLIDMSDEDKLDFFSRIQGWGVGLVVLTLEVENKVKYGKRLKELLAISPPSISLLGKVPDSTMNYTKVSWDKRKEIVGDFFRRKKCSNIALCVPNSQIDLGKELIKQMEDEQLKVTLFSTENELKPFDYQVLGQAVAYDIVQSSAKYDGIYAIYDEITFGIYEVFGKFGIKVPDDVVMISGGDCVFCNLFSPPIPIFVHDSSELAELAAEDLVKRIESQDNKPGNSECVGVVHQKIVETEDIYQSRTLNNEIKIIKKEFGKIESSKNK